MMSSSKDAERHDGKDGHTVVQSAIHPRDSVSRLRWRIVLFGNLILSAIGGYDTSNAANVQVSIHQSFGQIELLPWVGLSYSLTGIAVIPLIRTLMPFCNMKWMGFVSCLLTLAGSALAGAALNIESIIVGRVVMSLGSVSLYQIILSYNVIFARPAELPLVQALVGACFALGLLAGPIVGGAFSENEHTTWRWAFYVIVPIVASASSVLLLYPSHRQPTKRSVLQNLRDIDWVGGILWIGIFVLFGLASVFSGTTWSWGSRSAVATWTLFGVIVCAFAAQQFLCLFTSPKKRALPWHLLKKRHISLPTLCVWMAAAAYGVTLYYTPIYFGFTRERGALAAAVRILPFISVFIFFTFLSGLLLPRLRYPKAFFLLGGALVLIGGGLQHTITAQSSEARVMGFEAIIGAGVGLMWSISLPISSVVLHPRDHTDAAALFNMAQMGGVAASLAISGAIYENIGAQKIGDVASGLDFSSHDMRELLAGTGSSALDALGRPEVLASIVKAVTESIVSCFYITLAAGAICLAAASCMHFERLDFMGVVTVPYEDE